MRWFCASFRTRCDHYSGVTSRPDGCTAEVPPSRFALEFVLYVGFRDGLQCHQYTRLSCTSGEDHTGSYPSSLLPYCTVLLLKIHTEPTIRFSVHDDGSFTSAVSGTLVCYRDLWCCRLGEGNIWSEGRGSRQKQCTAKESHCQ